MTIQRFSSRTLDLHKDFLAKALEGAKAYYRIAGYFRSSIFELIGEELDKIPVVRVLCNSDLDAMDFRVAASREVALKEQWNKVDVVAEALLHKERYRRLDQLLRQGNVEIRVLPKEKIFLHGKAGSIHYADGSRRAFIGSVNETKNAFTVNYELAWQDDAPEAADWVEEEFHALWDEAVPLPQAILDEIHRVAERHEVTVDQVEKKDLAGAALAEAPIYRGGEQLQPWQRSFVTMFLQHRESYGKARLLLADEVGVGKTLSMAASALLTTLMESGSEKNVLILAPSTLVWQWQVEMLDKLGVPTAVWSSQQKAWIGTEGQLLSPKKTPKSIAKCPYRIAIVSTGLVMHQRAKDKTFVKEVGELLKKKYGLVVLDEAHKARVGAANGNGEAQPNNLLAFINEIGKQTKHMILGTATPIQTRVRELWDLLGALSSGADFVLGDALSPWRNEERATGMVTGALRPSNTEQAWEWLCNPLPPNSDDIARNLRNRENIASKDFVVSREFPDLEFASREDTLTEALDPTYFKNNNPVLRHTVLRKRAELEKMGLLEKVGVQAHPLPSANHNYQGHFNGLGIETNTPFELAYEQAELFCKILGRRSASAGFMKTLMLQRICSSFASGLATARRLLEHSKPEPEDEVEDENDEVYEEEAQSTGILEEMTPAEAECLRNIIQQLERPEAVDPKLNTLKWFLTHFRTSNKTWREHGCIIFSQYYDTARWVAQELAAALPDEVIALYAGAGKSGLFRNDEFNSVERESIKSAVKSRDLQIVVATDAACEGLNLQTLGTLINIDLPWNPSRVEQRLGRIKRFGQSRSCVDMLNLVYKDTQDEKIYEVLSERLKNIYGIFGSLPDFMMDDWIENENDLRLRADTYMHEREHVRQAFDVKYNCSADPNANLWEQCTKVLSRRDIIAQTTSPW